MSDANGAELGVAGVASVLPPSYVDFKDLIRAEMTAVKAKMAELRKLHGQVRELCKTFQTQYRPRPCQHTPPMRLADAMQDAGSLHGTCADT